MPRLKFKKKCALCRDKMAIITSFSQFPVCDCCQMKRIKGNIADKEYEFLNINDKLYKESYFLRNIKENYLRYGNLSEKQIEAFKKVVKEMQGGKKEEKKEKEEEKKEKIGEKNKKKGEK